MMAAEDTLTELLDTTLCACTSHALIDNEGWCQHCGAHPALACADDCPVGKLDMRQAAGDLSSLDVCLITTGHRRWDDTRP